MPKKPPTHPHAQATIQGVINIDGQPWATVTETCKILDVDRQAIYDWRRRNNLRSHKIGRSLYIDYLHASAIHAARPGRHHTPLTPERIESELVSRRAA